MQKKENAKAREEAELYKRLTEQRKEEDGVEIMDEEEDEQPYQDDIRRKQMDTRGSTRSQKAGVPGPGSFVNAPLVYFPKQKTETEEEKI
jgi:hypothetical protein